VSEPVSSVGWAAILAAIALPTLVAAGGWWGGRSQHVELHELRSRVESQEAELRRLRQEVTMLEEDLDLVLDLD
jgi:cell division protein FtsB